MRTEHPQEMEQRLLNKRLRTQAGYTPESLRHPSSYQVLSDEDYHAAMEQFRAHSDYRTVHSAICHGKTNEERSVPYEKSDVCASHGPYVFDEQERILHVCNRGSIGTQRNISGQVVARIELRHT